MKKYLLQFIFTCYVASLVAGNDTVFVKKEYTIQQASKTPKIDGILNDEVWQNIVPITDFMQCNPTYCFPTSQKTEVKMIYDNTAIYISAQLFDTSPDSISKQLGNRDDDLNADNFRFAFDTYLTEQDAFIFIVTASGVQADNKFSDGSYNAVWESAVKLNDKGWAVEVKIPYSALRFPNKNEQLWGLQITRSINRKGEFDQWALTPKGNQSPLKYWGLLKGINNIKAPVRLSLTPYITAYTSHYPSDVEGESNYTKNITGGMDLKYGINESFTVDATLLPDFTQVQSDNVVKNLSAFEVYYEEQRPFFQEGNDLFQKGDLFYSRRIGRRPTEYYKVYSQTKEGEKIIKNPDQAKLLNATKVSGRTSSGLGVGLFNAVLDNTYAIARDSLGNERKILSEPFSDYSIVVFDQQMKHSSSVYLINTNVTRKYNYDNADVTGAGLNLNNKKNTYGIFAQGAMSNVFSKNDTIPDTYSDLFGYKYDANFNKTSGKFQFTLYRNAVSPTFNNNALGITRERNYINNGVYLNFTHFEPFGRFLNASVDVNYNFNQNFTSHRTIGMNIHLNSNATFRSFHTIYLGGNFEPIENIDYYEPRTLGRVFVRPKNSTVIWGGVNTNYRKKLSANLNVYGGRTGLISNTIGYNVYYGFDIEPTYRATDKFSVSIASSYANDNGDRGYVNKLEDGDIIFGVRVINSITNVISAKYLFKNNLSLSLRVRHYWNSGYYKGFYTLTDEGYLIDNISYNQNHDFNFNAFNVDMVFRWQFAPGSFVNLVWKNSIYDEGVIVVHDYSKNLENTMDAKQLNTISLKILYYFDYLYLRKKNNK